MQEKRRQDKEATERRLQLLLKAANLDVEALAALISAPTADANKSLQLEVGIASFYVRGKIN
ncbi:hypothetical protein TSUD_359230 [Trifolium subterraneum]|uniref:Uncharacterized protein n=1 Tax=Trifolium subterraneum TaxID=3900 RepID=A0A2Z6MIS3_TRISU|nr:hypothetical protein TSUD_359230 [Trifolium subterraneum]